MSPIKKIKLLLYRFFCTNLGKLILNILSFGVSVNNLELKTTNKNKKSNKFLVLITIDTESGYVRDNEYRVWQKEDPEAFIGCYQGIRNISDMLKRHKIKATFFLSTQCFSSEGAEYTKIKKAINNALKSGHEMGLHLHPDSDYAIQKKLSKKFEATSAFFYNYKEKLEIIRAAREIIKENLGSKIEKKLISFRWGNWALDAEGAKALDKNEFKIDSSATPGIKGHENDGMKYDWSKVKIHYPWRLSVKDHQSIHHNNSNMAEIPIATFSFFGIKLRADPVNSILLNKAFAEYYKKADRSLKPFLFVVITHSSEATYANGKPTKALKDLENFITLGKKYKNVKFCTLREAHSLIN